jgi:hypothetical protein
MKVLSTILPLLALNSVALAAPTANTVVTSNEHEISAISHELQVANQTPHIEGLAQAGLEQRDVLRQCKAVVIGVAATITAQAAYVLPLVYPVHWLYTSKLTFILNDDAVLLMSIP